MCKRATDFMVASLTALPIHFKTGRTNKPFKQSTHMVTRHFLKLGGKTQYSFI